MPTSRICGHVVDVRAGQKLTSGGSSDREANDWQVKPIGCSAIADTTTTPVVNVPSTARMMCGVTSPTSFCFTPDDPTDRRQPPSGKLQKRNTSSLKNASTPAPVYGGV